MEPFTTLRSKVIPLLDPDIDTDLIIPAQYVNVSGPEALAASLFARLRQRDPAFVLNDPSMRQRAIMLVGSNFGCGSSREAAAWALGAWGVRALIGLSFNMTFYNNCLQNGLLPLIVNPGLHRRICAAISKRPDATICIDLPAGRVEIEGENITFPTELEPFTRDLLIRGLDELQYLMERRDQISAYEARAGGRQ
jgi:3-isopropylmalate/(R)-2-methylmalate dehydratase small subunit